MASEVNKIAIRHGAATAGGRSLDGIFAAGGLLEKFHESFEIRDGQIAMADAIESAILSKRHLVVEAGTGTGKTLAYLVPAVAAAVASGKRVLISTGTKNLQEQLMEKDIPFLQRVLPRKFSAAYMKGRSNYACILRMKTADEQPILDGVGEVAMFRKVSEWFKTTEVGDRAELVDLPENIPFWNRVNARGEICLGTKCPDFESCFISKMRARAESADIVVVNHHLFFADLNIRDNDFGRVLPDYDVVIFDEAHLLEDIAAEYFGIQISNFRVEEVAKDAADLPIADAISASSIMRSVARLQEIASQFWQSISDRLRFDGRLTLTSDDFENVFSRAYIEQNADLLSDALSLLETEVKPLTDDVVEAQGIVKRLMQARSDLKFIVGKPDPNFVYWVERRGRGVFLQASPIDVSGILREKLFGAKDTCVLTSATLTADGSFDFVINRLGLDKAKTDKLIAASPFDFEEQAILYLPPGLPDPRSPEYTRLAADEIVRIITASHGRAFVLCTSVVSMTALYEIVSSLVDFPCFLQGSMSKTGLIERFRETPHAVLFATSSFWQGVDVQGEQLSCVIIDKLPFAVPSDPLVAARSRSINENGGDAFRDYSLPQAILSLRQGIGRLIRSRKDRGVIAILDPRLRSKGYGRNFLHSLPRMRVTKEMADVVRMFEDAEAE
ncbi:MAG: ATP-dependent DNA helicase [Acidobacteriota bacterium]|nr:MAG: ATP-dependent DNA helicase [Acidobacteriota bacterium]